MRNSASAYISGVLEYLTSEVFELALQDEEAKKMISAKSIRKVLKGDEELAQLTKSCIIPLLDN